MATAGTAGEAVGGVLGGAIGGVIGSLIPPPGLGGIIGRAVGSRVGRWAGRAAGTMLDEHISAMENAGEEADADAGEKEEEGTCRACQEACEQSAGEVKNNLYRNKRAEGGGGNHGYLNRMIEQMCGANGPGTPGWGTHIDELRGAQNRLRESYEPFQGEDGADPDCDPTQFFSREEREAINNILRGDGSWQPHNIPHLGSDHERCRSLPNARESGRMRDYLDIIRPDQSPMSGAPLTS